MVGKKNDGTGFDDDSFDDVEDFSDADYDADSFEDDNEFSDVNADDVDYEDGDFAEDEWQKDGEAASAKKGKKSKVGLGEKKKGLSFNAIVIIGAVVVGAVVMAMNISSEKAKRAERAPQDKSVFQSIMGMAGVMDGVLSGENEETAPTAADLNAREQRTKEEGFLNNPDAATPPQPTPISPLDTAEPLTPMPDSAVPTPRGPDDAPSTDTIPPIADQTLQPAPSASGENSSVSAAEILPSEPVPASVPAVPQEGLSAEDVLKQAMANREKKKASEEPLDQISSEKEKMPPHSSVAQTPAAEVLAEEQGKQDDIDLAEPVPAAPALTLTEKKSSPARDEMITALEGKVDTLLDRIDQLESELTSVKREKDNSYEQIEQSVSALREDVGKMKNRPAESPRRAQSEKVDFPSDDKVVTSAEKPRSAVKKAAKRPSAESPASSSSRWELRAAQPGRAWVSHPGERDMRGIEVGQSLEGIGTVTAINYQNGIWTVYGTQGQINQ